jgi:hypothetical protein
MSKEEKEKEIEDFLNTEASILNIIKYENIQDKSKKEENEFNEEEEEK